MGTYLDRSMQTFMEQQGQFRQQMGSMLGQTPWSMMNQLTERNMEMWKDFQENLVAGMGRNPNASAAPATGKDKDRSEEHTSELQSLMCISYAVFCLKKKNKDITNNNKNTQKNTENKSQVE